MTKPIHVVTRWEQFKRLTVWHPMHTDPSDDYRHGPRFWYPVFDLFMVALGVYALFFGSPLLNRLFAQWFVELLGVSIAAAAVLAGVGAVFPRLFLAEILGKLGLVFLLGGYAGTVAVLSRTEDPNGFIIITLFSLVWLLGPRLSWLFLRLSHSLRRTLLGRRVSACRSMKRGD